MKWGVIFNDLLFPFLLLTQIFHLYFMSLNQAQTSDKGDSYLLFLEKDIGHWVVSPFIISALF